MASFIENFNSLDPSFWTVSDGYANGDPSYDATWRAANTVVDRVSGLLTFSISPDASQDATRTYAAGQIASVGSAYGYGTYAVRMKASAEPGVLSTFFLYAGGAGEIDTQLGFFGDHSHGMLRCNYSANGVDGSLSGMAVELGFDPSADFHTYTMVWTAPGITWLVDGVLRATALNLGDTPTTPGQIYLNCWPNAEDAVAGDYSGHPTGAVYDWLSYTVTGENLVMGAASFVSDAVAVFRAGGTLTGTAVITNYGGTSAILPAVKISSTDPFGNAVDFGLVTDVSIPAGQTVPVSMSRTFSPTDAPGTWQGFFAYQADDGSWIAGNPFLFYVI